MDMSVRKPSPPLGGEGGARSVPGEVAGTALAAHLILSFSPLKGGEGTQVRTPVSICDSSGGRGNLTA